MKGFLKGCFAFLLGAFLLAQPMNADASTASSPNAGSDAVKFTIGGAEVDVSEAVVAEGLSFNVDALNMPVTEELLADIIPQYLTYVKDNNVSSAQVFIFRDAAVEDRIDDIRIPISETSQSLIADLKAAGVTFEVAVFEKNGQATYYKDITKATTLGFSRHSYISNTHWDFYGSGFEFRFIDCPFYGDDKVYLCYQDENKVMHKEDIAAYIDEWQGEKYISIFNKTWKISYPGLHMLVPKNANEAAQTVPASAADSSAAASNIVATNITMAETTGILSETISANASTIDSTVFKTLGASDTVTSLELNYGNLKYEFAKNDITDAAKSVVLGGTEVTSDAKTTVSSDVEYAIDFTHSGVLPGKASVTIPVGLADGTYNWCYVDENDNNALKESVEVTVAGGEVVVPLLHCSTYVLVKEDTGGNTGGNTGNNTANNNSNTNSSTNSNTNTSGSTTNTPSTTSSTSGGTALTNVPKTADNFPAEWLVLAFAVLVLVWSKTKDEKKAVRS